MSKQPTPPAAADNTPPPLTEAALTQLGPSKKRITKDDEVPEIAELKALQVEMETIDAECSEEQMLTQQKFDEKKKPLFEARQKLIESIPQFWGTALLVCCRLNQEFFHEEDKKILLNLKEIKVEDNLDCYGSYKLTFMFNDDVKEWFEPTELTKHVRFQKEKDDVHPKEVTESFTEIKWKEGKRPQEDDNGSLLEWFTDECDNTAAELGELVRRQTYHHPHFFYNVGLDSLEDDDDDDDDDEDEDEHDEDDDDESTKKKNSTVDVDNDTTTKKGSK
eukprot:Lankesteria_metandrocarpae@DN95_c0_g1_i1.p1